MTHAVFTTVTKIRYSIFG